MRVRLIKDLLCGSVIFQFLLTRATKSKERLKTGIVYFNKYVRRELVRMYCQYDNIILSTIFWDAFETLINIISSLSIKAPVSIAGNDREGLCIQPPRRKGNQREIQYLLVCNNLAGLRFL